MARYITITDEHSSDKPKQVIKKELQGGSPWIAYIWIDDACYEIYRSDTGRAYKIKRVV